MLSSDFTLVATNVPYLLRAKQCVELQAYCDRYAPDATADLATVFLDRCALAMLKRWFTCHRDASELAVSEVVFQVSPPPLDHPRSPPRCGGGLRGHGYCELGRTSSVAYFFARPRRSRLCGDRRRHRCREGRATKSELLRANDVMSTSVSTLLASPSCRIALAASAGGNKLSAYASSLQGLSTGD